MKTKKLAALVLVLLLLSTMLTGCALENKNDKGVPVSQSQKVNISDQTEAIPGNENGDEMQTGGQLKVHFIDVGQGDAILVQSPAGENMLVDAGDNDYGKQVVDYLRSQGVEYLDIVVGTHPHADHIGGMDTVINSFPVGSIYMPRVTTSSRSFEDVLTAVKNKGLQIKTACAGITLPLKGVQADILAPVGKKYEDLNNYSAVIKLNYGVKSFLFTGDAEHESENQMMASGVNLKATVLKIGHHGSSSSTGEKFLQSVSPEFAVIMVGKDNPYGHPHKETLNTLAEAGIKIFRTDQNGTIVISTDGKTINIKTKR